MFWDPIYVKRPEWADPETESRLVVAGGMGSECYRVQVSFGVMGLFQKQAVEMAAHSE